MIITKTPKAAYIADGPTSSPVVAKLAYKQATYLLCADSEVYCQLDHDPVAGFAYGHGADPGPVFYVGTAGESENSPEARLGILVGNLIPGMQKSGWLSGQFGMQPTHGYQGESALYSYQVSV